MRLLARVVLAFAVPSLALGAEPSTARPPAAGRKQVLVPRSGELPFSGAVRGGELVFVSGQLGLTPGEGKRELVPGGVVPEVNAALENVAAVLGKAGLTMDDVVKCTVFLVDIADFAAMNDAYARFFPRDPPARTTVSVAGLVRKARVEIECIAAAR